VGMSAAQMPRHEISENLGIPISTISDTYKKDKEWDSGLEKRRKVRPRKTTKTQDEKILHLALDDCHQNYESIRVMVVPDIFIPTVRPRLCEKHLRKWRAIKRTQLEE
jgi:hypothetical protein